MQWYRNVIYKLKKNTKRKIVLRLHPGEKPWLLKKYYELAEKSQISISKHKFTRKTGFNENSLLVDLENAWAVIGYNTGALLKSMIYGIPAFFPDQSYIGYELSNHSLKTLENPILHDRTQFFNDLAYTMWHYTEMNQGLPWQHLRKYINEN